MVVEGKEGGEEGKRKTGKTRKTGNTWKPEELGETTEIGPSAALGWCAETGLGSFCTETSRRGDIFRLLIVFSCFWTGGIWGIVRIISFSQLREVGEGALEHLLLTGLIALEKGELVGAGEYAEGCRHPMGMLSGRLGIDGLFKRVVSMHQPRRWRQ
jgi:hypothetical protein